MENIVNSFNTAGLQCPNLSDNRMLIKFIDPGRLGVVFGARVLGCMCLKGFFNLIEKYQSTMITIRAGETEKVSLGNCINYGYRRETWVFNITDAITANQTINASLGIPSEIESFAFQSSLNTIGFVTNLRAAINASTFLRANFEIPSFDEATKTFILRTIKSGIDLTCDFTYGTQPIIGTQTLSNTRYPNGRCVFMFLLVDYDEFTAPIPASNKKHLVYAYDDDYIDNTLTPENIKWRTMGKMFSNSSDIDLDELDTNLIETIWIKNPLDYDVTMQVLIAS